MAIARSFPLLVIPVVIYHALVFAMGGVETPSAAVTTSLKEPVGQIPMSVSGTLWQLQTGDVIMLIGLVALFFGLVTSSRSANNVLLKHVLNMLLFIVCLVEFLLLGAFATSTFFLLTTMVLMETVAGFIITSIAARKDIGMAH